MNNLNFNDGYREYSINNDENRVIRFNPADVSIIERIKKVYGAIDDASKDLGDIELKNDGTPIESMESYASVVERLNETIREQIDYLLNGKFSNAVFGNQSPLSMVNGEPLYVGFLNSIVPEIKREAEKQRKESEKHILKYAKPKK